MAVYRKVFGFEDFFFFFDKIDVQFTESRTRTQIQKAELNTLFLLTGLILM